MSGKPERNGQNKEQALFKNIIHEASLEIEMETITQRSQVNSVLKHPDSRLVKKARCKAREKSTSGGVFTHTLERGDRAQRSRWPFSTAWTSLLTREEQLSKISLQFL
jgi:hypothetical protein